MLMRSESRAARPRVSLLVLYCTSVLYSNFIDVKWEKEPLVPRLAEYTDGHCDGNFLVSTVVLLY